MPLYLHIFEPRYKKMVHECLQEERPFGVVLIRNGKEIGNLAETFEVGTTAHITHVKHLEDGEMKITTQGQQRFRITDFHYRNPYLTGLVEDFPFSNRQGAACLSIARQLAPMVKKYLEIFATLGKVDFKLGKLPEDPAMLAFMTAMILNVPVLDKQSLLATSDLIALLQAEQQMLAREARILKHLIEHGPRWRDDSQLFSPN